jgi:hypothetical protein
MTTTARVLGFLLALGAVFGVAFGVGGAVGPLTGTEPAAMDHASGDGTRTHDAGHESQDVGLPSGLSVTENGYTLRLDRVSPAAGRDTPVSFTVVGPDGQAVTAYDVDHGKRLHLIAVRRDLTGYQHVHPTLSGGTWSTRLDLTPGTWRLFADFNPVGGTGTTLGADLAVAGRFLPRGPVAEARTDRVDGYAVTVDGALEAGHASELTLTVRRDGRPVRDLQPYLGAYGHLVALREGDLAYLHVHPEGSPHDGATAPGPEVDFVAEVPSAGRYRLFLDFKHAGEVRTAELALAAEEDR